MQVQTTTNGRPISVRNQIISRGDRFMHPEYGVVELVTFDGRQGDVRTQAGETIPLGVIALKLLQKV